MRNYRGCAIAGEEAQGVLVVFCSSRGESPRHSLGLKYKTTLLMVLLMDMLFKFSLFSLFNADVVLPETALSSGFQELCD